MNNRKLVSAIKDIGLSQKAARVYLAALDLGEATVLQLSQRTRLKRTTLYYTIDELIAAGSLTKTLRKKKTYYVAEDPFVVLTLSRERLTHFEDIVGVLKKRRNSVSKKPRVYFLFGLIGFKQAWEKILSTDESEYRITTSGEGLLGFVKEEYVKEHIVALKKKRGLKSRQLMTQSPQTEKIAAKDNQENRVSRIIPTRKVLPFTEIVSGTVTVCISSRFENVLLIIEDSSFAKYRAMMFDFLWDALEK